MILGHAHPGVLTAVRETAAPRHQLRRADRARDRARRGGQATRCRRSSSCASSSSGTEAAMSARPPGARGHGPQQDPQVRRLLPRPRRRAARRGRLGPRDARRSRLARRAAGDGRGHADRRRSTTSTASRDAVAAPRRRDRRVIVEPVAGNMGCVPPAPRLPRGAARGLRRARRAARLRRGHDRLPRRARRRAGALRRSRPT